MADAETRAKHRAWVQHCANNTRDAADEMARMYDGCDDPLRPWNPGAFRDWQDFVDRVARPLVEADGDEPATQAAMRLYRTANPYFICVCMVMMDNRLKGVTRDPETHTHDGVRLDHAIHPRRPALTDKIVPEELTYEQRQALPAKYHQPTWDGIGSPHSWICEVCWDDGLVTSWPCDVANAGNNGLEIAQAGGMRYAW